MIREGYLGLLFPPRFVRRTGDDGNRSSFVKPFAVAVGARGLMPVEAVFNSGDAVPSRRQKLNQGCGHPSLAAVGIADHRDHRRRSVQYGVIGRL
jgi:hypothetical protein